MHEGFLFGVKFVGSEITCDKFKFEIISSIFFPAGVVSPSAHQNWECPLKSPVKKVANGFSFLISACSFSKLFTKV